MRVNRVLDKLRSNFPRKGIACSALTLAALLDDHAVGAAPTPLADNATSTVRSSGTSRTEKLIEIARAIAAIDPKLYQATMKSFLDYHPEMDRVLRGTAPVGFNGGKN